jgi:hypothetical protein
LELSASYSVVDGKKFYFTEGDDLYAIKVKGLAVSIQKYNPKIPKHIDTKIYVEALPEDIKLLDILKVGEKYYLFFKKSIRSREVEENKEYLYCKEIDLEDLSLQEDYQTVLEIPGRFKNYNGFDFNLSPDKSKLQVYYTKAPTKKINKLNYEKIGFHVFDQNMEQIVMAEIEMPYSEAEMGLRNVYMNNKGASYCSLVNYETGVRKLLKVNLEAKSIKVISFPSTESWGDIVFFKEKRRISM